MEEIDKPHAKAESTFIHPAIKCKQELKDWILLSLGSPSITIELTDEQMDVCIADALTIYSKYASFPREDLIIDAKEYIPGKGVDLKRYSVATVYDISFENSAFGQLFGIGNNDIMWGMGAYLQQGASGGLFPFFNNGRSYGTGWVSLHNLHENISLISRMTGSMPQFRYNQYTGFMKIIPEPVKWINCRILIDCEIEPEPEILYGNEYVRRIAKAKCMILLGLIRKKFTNVQLLGSGQVDAEIGNQGQQELDKIMEQIRNDESFVGSLFHIN